jgi:4-hydroxybenzoate polyprenyltransferase
VKSWILYGNFWVSAGAASLALVTCYIHQISPDPAMILLVFFSSLFIYNYHRIFRMDHLYGNLNSERHRWIIDHRKGLLYITCLSGLLSLILSVVKLPVNTWLSALPVGLIAVLYVVPLYRNNGSWKRLRDIPFLKVFLIALVWTYATAFLPIFVYRNDALLNGSAWLTLGHRFIFLLAITLPFDIRDLEHDRHYGVRTFASHFGVDRLRKICHGLLIAMLMLVFTGMQWGIYTPPHAAGLLISDLGTGWLIGRLQANNSEFYYTAMLDGSMTDQLFWVWLIGMLA